jgi:hypothetical protein
MFYPNTDETALEVQGADPTTRQTALLYAASSDVFFEGVGKEERYDLKPGITAYARKHWPRFYAAPMSVFTNDVSGIEKTFFYAISGEKFRGAYTDVEPVLAGEAATLHFANNGFAMQEGVVLHEIGHAVDAWENDPRTNREDSHGAVFAGINIALVREFLSAEKADQLKNAFMYAGVKIK